MDEFEQQINLAWAKHFPYGEGQVFYSLHDSTNSTMEEAKRLTVESPFLPTARHHPLLRFCGFSLAHEQQQGRGRHSRVWVSERGRGVYVTFNFAVDRPLSAFAGYSLSVGCSVFKALRELGVETKLKWPNDVVVDIGGDLRKLSGILIESSSGAETRVLVGIGLNVLRAENPAPIQISIEELIGRRLDIADVFAVLAREVLRDLVDFLDEGLAASLELWRQNSFLDGHSVRVKLGGEEVEGLVQGIDSDGSLLIIDLAGKTRAISSNEVQILGYW